MFLTMFIVPIKGTPGFEVQPVFTFQDERTNITYYDGVRIPDSWRLGEVDGGVTVMSAALELEHGGGFGKTQSHMLRAAEELCREISWQGRPLIEDASAQRRLARTYANVEVSHLLGHRSDVPVRPARGDHHVVAERRLLLDVDRHHVLGLGLVEPMEDMGKQGFRAVTGHKLGRRRALASTLKCAWHLVLGILLSSNPMRAAAPEAASAKYCQGRNLRTRRGEIRYLSKDSPSLSPFSRPPDAVPIRIVGG